MIKKSFLLNFIKLITWWKFMTISIILIEMFVLRISSGSKCPVFLSEYVSSLWNGNSDTCPTCLYCIKLVVLVSSHEVFSDRNMYRKMCHWFTQTSSPLQPWLDAGCQNIFRACALCLSPWFRHSLLFLCWIWFFAVLVSVSGRLS